MKKLIFIPLLVETVNEEFKIIHRMKLSKYTFQSTQSTLCPKCNNIRVADDMCWNMGCDYKV